MHGRLVGIAASSLVAMASLAADAKADMMASQTIVEVTTVEGQEEVVANELEITGDGDGLLIQWSLSYVAYTATQGGDRGRRQEATLDLVASLVRDDATLAEWHLDYGTARQGVGDQIAAIHVKGTASGSIVDQPPAGSHRYRLRVRDDGPGIASRFLSISSRTMIASRR